MRSAVLLIAFNRLHYTKETFAEIAHAKPPRLYLACDGARPNKVGEAELVQELRTWLLENINWECDVHTRFLETNSGGCRNGVSSAVTWFFSHEPEGIILEDDCVASQTFFTFCDELLDLYRENKKIFHISGSNQSKEAVDFAESYYFAQIQHCWGWATWADRWKQYPLDYSEFRDTEFSMLSSDIRRQAYWMKIFHEMKEHQIDAWDYEWAFIILNQNGLCVNSVLNLVTNIGEEGVHFDATQSNDILNQKRYEITQIVHPKDIAINNELNEKNLCHAFPAGKIRKSFIKNYIKWYPNFIAKKFFWRLLLAYLKNKISIF